MAEGDQFHFPSRLGPEYGAIATYKHDWGGAYKSNK